MVLAGVHNSLRAQTQARLDDAFVGLDSSKNRPSGVGLVPVIGERPNAIALTSRVDNGDFNKVTANKVTFQLGQIPLLVVVKKYASILRNLHSWVVSLNESPDLRGQIRDIPLLLIDDEADHASINTRNEELAPTTINSLIRQILESFHKSAYVGYTATPFANLFIGDTVADARYGEDLFPRSFIVALRPPSNYFGPAELFGFRDRPEVGLASREELPLIRQVDDHESWIPSKHKKLTRPGELPASLKEAVRAFLLTCAARRVRGHGRTNSMLVHVTRFVDVQDAVYEQVSDFVSELKHLIRYGRREPEQIRELRELWTSDFEQTTAGMIENPDIPVPKEDGDTSWSEVLTELPKAVEHLVVRRVNGTARDALDYEAQSGDYSVIAIGGDKLSRGLTLEGLSVSYYLRTTRMYDTLMQMGRWFGYREGYLDLCRLYTTRELRGWYCDIASAAEELWREFEAMALANKTPKNYGLRVRSHPGILLVTAATKMRNGQTRKLSYSGTLAESVTFDMDEEERRSNRRSLENLISSLPGEPERSTSEDLIWRGVNHDQVCEFLEALTYVPEVRKAQPRYMARYIRKQSELGELLDWTVVLVSSTAGAKELISGHLVGLTKRGAKGSVGTRYAIGRLLDPKHEYFDLTPDEFRDAEKHTIRLFREEKTKHKSEPEEPAGPSIRLARPVGRGLLLLYPLSAADVGGGELLVGFGVSFPHSGRATPVNYVVTNTFARMEQMEMELEG